MKDLDHSKAKSQLLNRIYPRKELYSLLLEYNQTIGNDSLAQAQIEKILDPQSFCIITGQQLGLIGGPAYTILKGINCLQLSKEFNAIPIFWLATEDHDLSEIDHTYLINALGNLKEYRLHFPFGSSVEDLILTPHHQEIIDSFLDTVHQKRFEKKESYSETMASFLAKIFAGTGMVFVEPKLIRGLAKGFFEKELLYHKETLNCIQKSTSHLLQEGGRAPLNIKEGTFLFMKQAHKREKIHAVNENFFVGNQKYSLDELKKEVDLHPEKFSANVAARTVLQSQLFPTFAYVAGPAEMDYYRQLKEYHAFHEVPMPWIVPRISVTFIDKEASVWLNKLKISPESPFSSDWNSLFLDLQNKKELLEKNYVDSALSLFHEGISQKQLKRYLKHSLDKIYDKVLDHILKEKNIPHHALHYLHHLIFPHGQSQERVLNWYVFQKMTEKNLLFQVIKEVPWHTKKRTVVIVE